MTCVSMGNPHAITYGSSDGQPVKVTYQHPYTLSTMSHLVWRWKSRTLFWTRAPILNPPIASPLTDLLSSKASAQPCSLKATDFPLILSIETSSNNHYAKVTEAHLILHSAQLLQVDDIDIYRIGPLFEKHGAFPARTNTEFIEVGKPFVPKQSLRSCRQPHLHDTAIHRLSQGALPWTP